VNTKSIQNFVLQSEVNFRTAAAVAEGWREARKQLMSSFLDRLETQLTKKLKGWKSSREGGFSNRWSGCYIAKPKWRDNYCIALDCWAEGSEVYIGIAWETDNVRKQARAEVLTALQTIDRSAKPYPRGVYAMLRSPAADWSKPDVLWRMHKKPEFVTDVANQLLAIAQVSEHIIDRWVRNE
jgi:hypothetical protein